MKQAGLQPDLILSSTALRAFSTATLVAQALHYPPEKIVLKETLYHAPPAVFEQEIAALPAHCTTVFIVAHNPGITEMANSLSRHFQIDNMPTCAVVAAEAQCSNWAAFHPSEKQISYYDYPKKISPEQL